MTSYPNAAAAKADWQWPNFTPEEWACKGDGTLLVIPSFMDRIQLLRQTVGFQLIVSSGYRSPAYNASVSHTGDGGPHTTGHAIDLTIRGAQALIVLKAALQLGFTGIGVSQKGEGRFLHLDDLPPESAPRPMIWSY